MQVACEHCGTEYSLNEENITGRGVRITCPSCSHVFTVYKPQEEIEIDLDLDEEISEAEEEIDIDIDLDLDLDEESNDGVEVAAEEFSLPIETNDESSVEVELSPELEDLPPVTEEALAAIDVNTLDFQKVGIKAWKVKSSIGLVYEFSDYKTLKNWMKTGRVKSADPLSYDGVEWTPINTIPDLERHFCQVYLTFLKKQESGEIELPLKKNKIQEKVIQPSGGISELDAAIADLTAEVDGANAQSRIKKPTANTNRRPTRPVSRPPEKKSSSLPLVLIALVVLVGVFLFIKPSNESVAKEPVAVEKPQPKKGKNEEALRAEIQAQIKATAAKKAEEEEKEEPKEVEEEQQLLVKIPDEILRANGKAVPSNDAANPPSTKPLDYAEEGKKALSQKRWMDAVTAYQKAYEKNPSAQYRERWGYALYQAGKTSDAKKILKQAVKDGNNTANKWLGEIYKNLGDDANANTYYHAYLKSNPTDAASIRRKMSN